MMKKRLLIFLVLACFLLCGCGKNSAVRRVEEKIAAIGYVTVDSEAAIEEAEAALNALSLKQREKVENASILTAARETWRNAVAEKEEQERQARLQTLRQQLIGTWNFTQDVTDLYAQTLDKVMTSMMGPSDMHFTDYVDTISAEGSLTLLQNGTYKIGFDKAQQERFVDSLMTPLTKYYNEMMRAVAKELLMMEGVYVEDARSDEAWIAATGMSFDALMAADMGMSEDGYMDYLMQMLRGMLLDMLGQNPDKMGNYQVEEGRLLISGSLEEPVDEGRFVSFSLDGDRLTFTGFTNVSEFGNRYPFIMSRMK